MIQELRWALSWIKSNNQDNCFIIVVIISIITKHSALIYSSECGIDELRVIKSSVICVKPESQFVVEFVLV